LTISAVGVLTELMQLFRVKIFNKLFNLKTSFLKIGIFISLAAYWSVILLGTFISFN